VAKEGRKKKGRKEGRGRIKAPRSLSEEKSAPRKDWD
jgi:hypothetical protein